MHQKETFPAAMGRRNQQNWESTFSSGWTFPRHIVELWRFPVPARFVELAVGRDPVGWNHTQLGSLDCSHKYVCFRMIHDKVAMLQRTKHFFHVLSMLRLCAAGNKLSIYEKVSVRFYSISRLSMLLRWHLLYWELKLTCLVNPTSWWSFNPCSSKRPSAVGRL